MAIMSPSKKTVVKPPKGVREQRLMDNISALSEGDDEKRIVAATDIVKFLLSKQNQVSINASDNMGIMAYFDLKRGLPISATMFARTIGAIQVLRNAFYHTFDPHPPLRNAS